MGLTLITAPGSEPVTFEEAKAYLKITGSAMDEQIRSFIRSVRRAGERASGRAFMTQTWDYFIDFFPASVIQLPRPPLASVTYVKYVATDGTLTTLASTDYQVSTSREPGTIEPSWDAGSWPADVRAVTDAVVIRFVAGYGDTPEEVPEDIRSAILKGCLLEETGQGGGTNLVAELFTDFWHGCHDILDL